MTAMNATPTGDERRAHMRWSPPSSELDVTLRFGEATHRCRLKDISAGGAALISDAGVEIGSVVVVELSRAMRLSGSVIRAHSDGMAVKFDVTPILAKHIEQAIQLGLAPAEW